MAIMEAFVQDLFDKIAQEAGRLARYNRSTKITAREIQTSVRLIFPGVLAKHAVSEGTKSITKYCSEPKYYPLDDDAVQTQGKEEDNDIEQEESMEFMPEEDEEEEEEDDDDDELGIFKKLKSSDK